MKNNLSVFGQKLKEIRKNLGLTQDDVVQKTNGNISRPTLQRYESGKYAPSIEALTFLSDVYQLDLYEYFLIFQKEQLPQIQQVETLFYKNFSPITSFQLLKQLSELLRKDSLPPHIKPYYMRLFLLTKGVHLKFRKNYKKAIPILLRALRLRFKNFNLKNYADFSYFSLDYRILCNLADALNKCSAFLIPKAKEIYQFMYQNCPESYPVYPQICFHLGFLLINQQQHSHAKTVLEKGIRASQAHLSYSLLPQLYYAKAVCEYYLSPSLCSHTFLYSYVLAKAFDNEEFAEWISDVCSNFYQLKLELE